MMNIRKVKAGDLDEWQRMRSCLWPDSGDDHRSELRAFYNGQSHDIHKVFVVQRQQAGLAGFIEISLRSMVEGSRHSPVPYIEAWFVDQDCRGRGAGRALMLAAEQWAVDQGYCELGSDTELSNHYSLKLHKELGFKEIDRIVCLLKPLQL